MKEKHPDIVLNKFGTKVLIRNTASYGTFINESVNLEFMLMFILFAEHNDKDKLKSQLAELFKEEDPSVASEKLETFFKSEDSDAIFDMNSYELYFGQMAYCRLVDNALCYFKDVLSEVVVKEPRVLKSKKEKESYDFMLSFENIDELKKALSDKKIKELFYGSIEDIKKYFLVNLGIKLFDNESEEKDFTMATKQRNLIVHNRGIITQELADEFPTFKEIVGQQLLFKYDKLSIINESINNLIIEIDIKLREKFNLETFEE